MQFSKTNLNGVFLIDLVQIKDERGVFFRTFCKDEFKSIGHSGEFIQANHSINYAQGTIRGLHYQKMPHNEAKLIRCIRGKIYDVIVDIRHESPTFLHYFGIELSPEKYNMLYMGEGFAHGFQTLTDDCELLYHHTAAYEVSSEQGIRYNDERLGIKWPIDDVLISDKDSKYPLLTTDFEGIRP